MVDADGLLAPWVQEWPESGSVLAGASVLAGREKLDSFCRSHWGRHVGLSVGRVAPFLSQIRT